MLAELARFSVGDRAAMSGPDASRVSHPTGVDDAELVDRIRRLVAVKAAAAAAQAAQVTRFAASQEAAARRRGTPRRRIADGIADQVALACKISPVTAARRITVARTLTSQLPHAFRLLADGTVSDWVATLMVRETTELTPEHRTQVDPHLAPLLGAGGAAAALLTGYVPCEQGIAAWATLTRHARTSRAQGDHRSLDHIHNHADGGPTTATNGQGLCERHNYTRQLPGWQTALVNETPHTVTITTPTAHTYQSTAPPTPESRSPAASTDPPAGQIAEIITA
jgi:hypothetical protein